MSHFTVLVIGENPEDQLAPFQENNMGDCPQEYLKLHVDGVYYESKEDAISKGVSEEEIKDSYWDNPNKKWDWYSLGGRWSGMIKVKENAKLAVIGRSGVFGNEPGIDQAIKGEIINLDEIKTFAVLKDGKWYERGSMGWWGIVSNEKNNDEWDTQFTKLLSEIPDDTLLSVFDCHI